MIVLPVNPKGKRKPIDYGFAVITKTPADYRHPTSPAHEFDERYCKGQILVCELLGDAGGIPMELATYIKPGKLDFKYEVFSSSSMGAAIDFSHFVTHGDFDQADEGRQKNTWQGKRGKQRRKVRHQA